MNLFSWDWLETLYRRGFCVIFCASYVPSHEGGGWQETTDIELKPYWKHMRQAMLSMPQLIKSLFIAPNARGKRIWRMTRSVPFCAQCPLIDFNMLAMTKITIVSVEMKKFQTTVRWLTIFRRKKYFRAMSHRHRRTKKKLLRSFFAFKGNAWMFASIDAAERKQFTHQPSMIRSAKNLLRENQFVSIYVSLASVRIPTGSFH